MTSQQTPARQLREARQIAAEHGLVVFEKSPSPGQTDYIVVRKLPDGRVTRLGKRGTVGALCAYIARLTRVVH